MRPRVVMKFGGTSVGDARAIRRVTAHVRREARPCLVVVSALGGMTNLLLEASAAARCGADTAPLVAKIQERHAEVVQSFGLPPALLADFFAALDRLLRGVAMLGELTPRIQDELCSLGERMSVRLVAAALDQAGRPARAFDSWELGFQTSATHGKAEILPDAPARIREAFEALPADLTPVTNGFIGRSQEGAITTIGRGGSDLSAAIFGAALGVEEIQIWTDVAGILRADPRVVPEARIIPSLRFEEAAELAFFGAKVLHPRTIEPARKAGIPVRVLGTFQVDPLGEEPIGAQGTLIDDQAPSAPVRALAIRHGVQTLHIHSLRMLAAHGFLSRVFEILSRHQISVDVIATSEVSVSMTLDRLEHDLQEAVCEISTFAQVEAVADRSILCVVGSGMREDITLLAKVFQVLSRNHVPVHLISQGASQINITLVTDPAHAATALAALHRELFKAPR